MIYKYYGPPGTGKTYRLISRAKAYIRIGTPLDKIGYFAFTKKAAGEAKERMSPVSPRRLSYFRTLHSLGFDCLDNINQDNVMQPYHYEDFGKKVNLQVKYYDRYNSDESFYLGFDNPYFQIIHKAVNRCVTLREQFDLEEHDTKNVNWKTLKHIHDNLLVYKDKKNLFDFNDMIKMLVDRSDKIPNFDVVFIDEAQDLSPLQWRLYDILKAKTKDIYLAGDDDQAIFEWAGADVKRFIQEPAKERVLNRSKRISKAVQAQSTIPISNIVGIRKLKKYYPRDYEGECLKINNLDQIDLTEGKWLILTRTISRLIKMTKELRKRNLYHYTNKGKSFVVRIYNASINYNSWCRGIKLDEKEIKDVEEYTGLKQNKWDNTIDWFDAFKKADLSEKEYIKNMIDNGEDLDDRARIKVSTIHAAKGGEEDSVILCLDIGDKIKKAIKKSQAKHDEEHRVWYVGGTRARNNLYKLKARIKRNEYKHI